jgi:molecular chaperone DnaK
MPMVEQMLQGLAGKAPDRSVSADEAVAHGAALYADLLRQKKATGGNGRFSIINVNSHSLGIVGVDTRLRRKVNKILIPKNSPLPASRNRRFKTAKENQRSLLIRVVEGENEQPEACSQVGSFVIRDLPQGLPKGWPIEVSYRYDDSGCLKVSAKLLGHSVQGTSEFVRNNTLTDDDLLLWGQRLREASGKLHL